MDKLPLHFSRPLCPACLPRFFAHRFIPTHPDPRLLSPRHERRRQMDGSAAIEWNRVALRRIVLSLFAMAGLAGSSSLARQDGSARQGQRRAAKRSNRPFLGKSIPTLPLSLTLRWPLHGKPDGHRPFRQGPVYPGPRGGAAERFEPRERDQGPWVAVSSLLNRASPAF